MLYANEIKKKGPFDKIVISFNLLLLFCIFFLGLGFVKKEKEKKKTNRWKNNRMFSK